jgi:hypothetical protein
VFSPCGPLTKHWVKGHQLENIDRFEAKLGGDPFRGLIADEAKMFLPEMEQRKGSTPFLIERIMADRLIHLCFELGWNLHPASELFVRVPQ